MLWKQLWQSKCSNPAIWWCHERCCIKVRCPPFFAKQYSIWISHFWTSDTGFAIGDRIILQNQKQYRMSYLCARPKGLWWKVGRYCHSMSILFLSLPPICSGHSVNSRSILQWTISIWTQFFTLFLFSSHKTLHLMSHIKDYATSASPHFCRTGFKTHSYTVFFS